jgi:acyl-CoA reductase-like NAD-dependent aldehyde dehydrogenase
MTHDETKRVVEHPSIMYVNFTGSVAAGREVQKAASTKFIGEFVYRRDVTYRILQYYYANMFYFIATGLELGGKDPAYVRSDADLDYAVEQLVDGCFFNSGQCCCAIERIYVHEDIYDEFLEKFVERTKVR